MFKLLEMFSLIFLFISVVFFSSNEGLICWDCSGQSYGECLASGMLVSCNSPDDVCATTTRRTSRNMQVTKHCKPMIACVNDQKQNWLSGKNSQCGKSSPSICRCCCFDNYCNVEETCDADLIPQCPSFRNDFALGRYTCSNSSYTGSVCTFSCLQPNNIIRPPVSRQMECLPNGRWDKPIPCCGAPVSCPPILNLDLVVLMHVKDQATYDFTLPVTKLFLDQVEFGPGSLRYSLMYYSGSIHQPLLAFSDTANMSNSAAWEKVDSTFFHQRTDDGLVNTGAALWHVYDHIVGSGLDRDDARNCLVVITDENSSDDVAAPAAALRKAGVMIFTYFFQARPTDDVNRRQLLDMSANLKRTQVVSPQGRFEVTSDVILSDYFHKLCPVTCDSFMDNDV